MNKLPNAEKVKVDRRKLYKYSLNPNNTAGGSDKAKVFQSALGYNLSNAEQLVDQIYQNLAACEAVTGKKDHHGQRFTVDMPVTGVNGRTAVVRTGWIIDPGKSIPRMITVFVK
jgi:hypothetical protein